SGSVRSQTAAGRLRVFREEPEARGGIAPDRGQVGLQRLDPLVVQLVDAPGSASLVDDEARLFEQAQVPGDGRTADREGVSDLADRAAAIDQQLDDGSPVGVAESVEGIAACPDRAHNSTW